MSYDLNEILIFSKVVQTGSFTQASKLLNMPKSTVSAKVSSLEKRLGVTLLKRTTRKLHVTEAGQSYLRRCVQGLELIQSAETEAAMVQSEPQGRLRITAPVDFSSPGFRELMREFLKRYPKVEVELLLTDRMVDLVAEGVDVALRAGALEDSTLIAKKLGVSRFVPFASPDYLKKAGKLSHPRDLAKHECLLFTAEDDPSLWVLHRGSERVSIRVSGRIYANNLNMLREFAVSGLGIGLIPTTFCQQEIQKRLLVPILPDWSASTAPIHIVYPAQRFAPRHLQAFISMLSSYSDTILPDTLKTR
jgi:DNA-binding transcriptional LysR family regulator